MADEPFRCPDPVCDAAEWDIRQDTQTGALVAVCQHCKGHHPLADDDDLADAEACGVQWAEQLARDIAAVLDGTDRPLGEQWATVLHWFANRIRGGHLGVEADTGLRVAFGLPDDYLARQTVDMDKEATDG